MKIMLVLVFWALYIVFSIGEIHDKYKKGSIAGKRIYLGAILAGGGTLLLCAPMLYPAFWDYANSIFPVMFLVLCVFCGLCYILRRYIGLAVLVVETVLAGWGVYYFIIGGDIRRRASIVYENGESNSWSGLGFLLISTLLLLAVIAVTSIALTLDPFVAFMNYLEAKRLERTRKRQDSSR